MKLSWPLSRSLSRPLSGQIPEIGKYLGRSLASNLGGEIITGGSLVEVFDGTYYLLFLTNPKQVTSFWITSLQDCVDGGWDFTGLPALNYLRLRDTPLTTPPVLTGLTALSYLNLANTSLTTPPVLTGLTALSYLNLGYTPLTTPPVLTGLTALGSLFLNYTSLTTPPVLTGLTALGGLFLQDNESLNYLPDLTGVNSLGNIQIDNCSLLDSMQIDFFYMQLSENTNQIGGSVTSTGCVAPTASSLVARTSLTSAPRNWIIAF